MCFVDCSTLYEIDVDLSTKIFSDNQRRMQKGIARSAFKKDLYSFVHKTKYCFFIHGMIKINRYIEVKIRRFRMEF